MFVVEKVASRATCSVEQVSRNVRFRAGGSVFRWCWLAINISGRIHAVKIERGAVIWSKPNQGVVLLGLKFSGWCNHFSISSARIVV